MILPPCSQTQTSIEDTKAYNSGKSPVDYNGHSEDTADTVMNNKRKEKHQTLSSDVYKKTFKLKRWEYHITPYNGDHHSVCKHCVINKHVLYA